MIYCSRSCYKRGIFLTMTTYNQCHPRPHPHLISPSSHHVLLVAHCLDRCAIAVLLWVLIVSVADRPLPFWQHADQPFGVFVGLGRSHALCLLWACYACTFSTSRACKPSVFVTRFDQLRTNFPFSRLPCSNVWLEVRARTRPFSASLSRRSSISGLALRYAKGSRLMWPRFASRRLCDRWWRCLRRRQSSRDMASSSATPLLDQETAEKINGQLAWKPSLSEQGVLPLSTMPQTKKTILQKSNAVDSQNWCSLPALCVQCNLTSEGGKSSRFGPKRARSSCFRSLPMSCSSMCSHWIFSLSMKLPDLKDKRLHALEKEVFDKRVQAITGAVAIPLQAVQRLEAIVMMQTFPLEPGLFVSLILCTIFASLRFDDPKRVKPPRSGDAFGRLVLCSSANQS